MWIDMEKNCVDCIVTAPQKSFSGAAGIGVCCLSKRGREILKSDKVPKSSSFACDLRKWLDVADKYKDGGFMYHTTMPTETGKFIFNFKINKK